MKETILYAGSVKPDSIRTGSAPEKNYSTWIIGFAVGILIVFFLISRKKKSN